MSMDEELNFNKKSGNDFEELRLINNLLFKICGICETNHIMDIIIRQLIKSTGADQGIISLLSKSINDPLKTIIRAEKNKDNVIPYKLNNMIIGWVCKQKTLLKIDNIDRDDRFVGLNSEDGKYKHILCVPMIVRGVIIGVITLIRSEKGGVFSENHSKLTGILASQSAQILSNAHLNEELTKTVELLKLSQNQLTKENRLLKIKLSEKYGFENIIGKSPVMKRLMSNASKFTQSDSPVLITGETGTGKELIARAIHHNSQRSERPYIAINCGSSTESLLESELFGHVKGAFTGAINDKTGLFKEADGGSIFLDEIGDAPRKTQQTILRVIQEGEIRAVGSTKTERVDVRVISATNKDLKKEMDVGNFREDLYFRLSTFELHMPPLRERLDDVPLLIKYFIDKLKIKVAKEDLTISYSALNALQKYTWPGNVRQLENELEKAAVICGIDNKIEIEDLSAEIVIPDDLQESVKNYSGCLREITEKIEKEIIQKTLIEYQGNILQTSNVLGLTRNGLKNKMSRYNISVSKKSGSD